MTKTVMKAKELGKRRSELLREIEELEGMLPDLKAIWIQKEEEERTAKITLSGAKKHHIQTVAYANQAKGSYRIAASRILKLKRELEGLEHIRFIPEGADEPLPPVPDEVIITLEDVENALKDWDELMPDLAGLLNNNGKVDLDDKFDKEYGA